MKRVLITGVAGFIGSASALRLLDAGYSVFGLDSLPDDSALPLKRRRLQLFSQHPSFEWGRIDIRQPDVLRAAFDKFCPEIVLHLAAEVGVRKSATHPTPFVETNLGGFANVLECCRHPDVQQLLYASSSSVYGSNPDLPWSETTPTDSPVSLYAATKKANEVMAYAFTHLYGVPTTGLRFFSVYGPWGRPDMAYSLFAEKILAGQPVPLFFNGDHLRDFTYIDDVVSALMLIANRAEPKGAEVFNVGNGTPRRISDMVSLLEKYLHATATRELLPQQPVDAIATHADVKRLETELHFSPATSLEEGLARFCEWLVPPVTGAVSPFKAETRKGLISENRPSID